MHRPLYIYLYRYIHVSLVPRGQHTRICRPMRGPAHTESRRRAALHYRPPQPSDLRHMYTLVHSGQHHTLLPRGQHTRIRGRSAGCVLCALWAVSAAVLVGGYLVGVSISPSRGQHTRIRGHMRGPAHTASAQEEVHRSLYVNLYTYMHIYTYP